jgi:ribosomal protein S18 acetylase RimI-like enzyme
MMGVEFKKLSDISISKTVDLVNEIFADYVVPVKWDVLSFELDIKENSISLDDSFIMIVDGQNVGLSVNALRVPRGRIDAFGVRKYYRERGIGGALLLYSLDAMKWKGANEVLLEVAAGDRAARFYQKYGFMIRRSLHSFYTEEQVESSPYQFDRATLEEIYDEAFENEKEWRHPNWQREALTLKLSDDRYNHDFLLEKNRKIGYVVWGINENGAYIIDTASKSKEDFGEFFKRVLSSIQKVAKTQKVLIMNVPENDPLCKAVSEAGMRPFLGQWEMSKV